MNTKGLSLNSIPPAMIPLRFFLSAPVFGILAALLIIFYGSELWTSRWLPSSLALTHLITLGFIVMVMIGAMYQFIPVMVGQFIPASERLVPIIHPLLVVGTLSLTIGFILPFTILYWTALFSLALSLGLFALSLLPLLVSPLKQHLIVFILRVLLLVIVLTIGLGLMMLLSYAHPDINIFLRQYTDIHASWGLLGWVVLLIMAVSSQVIPMFFVTPEFSEKLLKLLSLLIVISLTALSLVIYYQFSHDIIWVIQLFLSLELAYIACYIFFLIQRRKRKLADVTINFFRVSLFSLLVAILFWWLYHSGIIVSLKVLQGQFEFSLALLLIYGLAVSAIIGMLQKIVPFLIYLNLHNLSFKHPQSMSSEPKLVLNMKLIITSSQSKIQFVLYLLSYLLLIISVFYTPLVLFAGVFMLANFLWLAYCLLKGFIFFINTKKYILSFPEMKMDFGL